MRYLETFGLVLVFTVVCCSGAFHTRLTAAPGHVIPEQSDSNAELITALAKRVIRGAAKVGLEEAGVRIIGPTGWKYAKAVIEPVFAELEKKFPALTLSATSEADAAAEKAASLLDSDRRLQRMLANEFERLDAGLRETLLGISRVENKLDEVLRRLPPSTSARSARNDKLETLRDYSKACSQLALAAHEMGVELEFYAKQPDSGSDAMTAMRDFMLGLTTLEGIEGAATPLFDVTVRACDSSASKVRSLEESVNGAMSRASCEVSRCNAAREQMARQIPK